jgi:hypothetical protein
MDAPSTTHNSALETCDALIIGLGVRRWVIVRREGEQPIRALDPARQRVRDLQVGDEVVYKDTIEIVRSIAVYA